jgi:hypothetical protein
VVVGDLREEMMNHMGPDIMVDVVNPSIVTVKGCKASSQIAPFLLTARKYRL